MYEFVAAYLYRQQVIVDISVSERTRAALAAKRASGAKLGNPRNLEQAGQVGRLSLLRAANGFARDLMPLVSTIQAGGSLTLRAIADELNRRGVKSARGGQWHPSAVANLLSRTEHSFL